MTTAPTDLLLEQLSRGDVAAAERVFTAYEPYLRRMVRRQLPRRLRAKFDSVDVVQSVWADVLTGFRQADWRFADRHRLWAFLVTAARNRLTDHVRHFRRELDHQRPLGAIDLDRLASAPQPRPSEIVQADDLWEKLLTLCPPAHHELLRLKRQGLRLAEIAARTGLHEGSVRRILRQLARQLACAEPAAVPSGKE